MVLVVVFSIKGTAAVTEFEKTRASNSSDSLPADR